MSLTAEDWLRPHLAWRLLVADSIYYASDLIYWVPGGATLPQGPCPNLSQISKNRA